MLFGHHPSQVDKVRDAARRAAESAHEFSEVAADLRGREAAVEANAEGALIVEPMVDLLTTTARSAVDLAGAALLAEGAFTAWADAVDVFNRTVDQLNDQYEMAYAMRFGVGLPPDVSDAADSASARVAYADQVHAARSVLIRELAVRHEQAEDQLDDIATKIAGTLDRGPSKSTLAWYASCGALRDSEAYNRHHHTSSTRSAVFKPGPTDLADLVINLSAGVSSKLTVKYSQDTLAAADSLTTFLTTMDADEVLTEPGSSWWDDFGRYSDAVHDAASKTETAGKIAGHLEPIQKYGGPTLLGAGILIDHYANHESWTEATTADTAGYVVGIAASTAGQAATVALGEGVTGLFAATATGAAAGSVVPVAGTVVGAFVGLVVGVVATGIVKKHWKGITHGLDDATKAGEHLMDNAAHAAASGWKHLWD